MFISEKTIMKVLREHIALYILYGDKITIHGNKKYTWKWWDILLSPFAVLHFAYSNTQASKYEIFGIVYYRYLINSIHSNDIVSLGIGEIGLTLPHIVLFSQYRNILTFIHTLTRDS